MAGLQFLSKTVKAETMKDVQAQGDVVRERLGSGLGVLVADFGDNKGGLGGGDRRPPTEGDYGRQRGEGSCR